MDERNLTRRDTFVQSGGRPFAVRPYQQGPRRRVTIVLRTPVIGVRRFDADPVACSAAVELDVAGAMDVLVDGGKCRE